MLNKLARRLVRVTSVDRLAAHKRVSGFRAERVIAA